MKRLQNAIRFAQMPSGDEKSSTLLVPGLCFKTYETALEIKGQRQSRFFFFFFLVEIPANCMHSLPNSIPFEI